MGGYLGSYGVQGITTPVLFVNQSREFCARELVVDCGCMLPVILRQDDFDKVCEELHLEPETCAERVTGYNRPLPSKVECKVKVARLTRCVQLEVFCAPEQALLLGG